MPWTMLSSGMNTLENKKPCFSASLTAKASDRWHFMAFDFHRH